MSEKIDLSNYVPSEEEEFMNGNQRAYFRAKLVAWRNDILREARETSTTWLRKAQTTRILQTGHRPKPTGLSNCVPATARES